MRRLVVFLTIVVAVAAGVYMVRTRAVQDAPSHEAATTSAPQSAVVVTENESVLPSPRVPRVVVGGQSLPVELADTPEKRMRGLSGRESLPENRGMLFVFPEEGIYGFWMKDMRFSIDILWLSSSGEVVHIVESVTPESYPESFTPEKAALYVLELPAGFARIHGVSLGSIVTLPR